MPASAIERFLPLVLEQEEEGSYVVPCFSSQGINYLHIRHNNLYRASSSSRPRSAPRDEPALTPLGALPLPPAVVALTKKNSNAAEILTFLHKLVSVRPSPARSCPIDRVRAADPAQLARRS